MKWVDKNSGPQLYDIVMDDGKWRYEDDNRFLHHPQGYEVRGRIDRSADGTFDWRIFSPIPDYPPDCGHGIALTLAEAKRNVEEGVASYQHTEAKQ